MQEGAMQHLAQVDLGHRFFAQLDARSSALAPGLYRNPVSDYTCPQQAALEAQLFFREHPLVMGLTGDLPKPGDYLTNDLAGPPVLLVRGDDGKVNAFLNVCRHRGAKVAQGCGGGKKVFTCPYHGWSYNRQGALVGLPEERLFGEVDRAEFGLRRLPVAEKHGLIWVRPTPGPDFDPDEMLGELAPELAAYDFGRYRHWETRTLHHKLNWKLVVDTFLEGYHIAMLHKATIAELFCKTVTFDAYGRNLRMGIARRAIDALRSRPEAEWDVLEQSALVYILYPNTVFIWQLDHVETFRAYPAGNGTDESVMDVSLYIPEPAESEKAKLHWMKNMDLLIRTVQGEDFPVGEDIQRGFRSGAQDSIVFGRNEPALHHYHRQIRAGLGLPAVG
jgi:phenylpropionate dioxygenase-like ring-hydroxylating dioxygenase large terminal subunit